MSLRKKIIRLAYDRPELREKLLPVLTASMDSVKETNEIGGRGVPLDKVLSPEALRDFIAALRSNRNREFDNIKGSKVKLPFMLMVSLDPGDRYKPNAFAVSLTTSYSSIIDVQGVRWYPDGDSEQGSFSFAQRVLSVEYIESYPKQAAKKLWERLEDFVYPF